MTNTTLECECFRKNTLGHNINQALKPSINMTKMNICAWRTKINSKNQAFKSCRYDTAET